MEKITRLALLSTTALFLLCTPTSGQSPAKSPAPGGPADIIAVLKKAGQYTTFIKLLKGTQVSDQINSQLSGSTQGITVFAPTDSAFSNLKTGTLNSLTSEQQLHLVQYHVLPAFYSLSQFQTVSNPIHTQAGNSENGQYPLNVTTSTGNQVNITTGVVNATVSNTVYTDGQLSVFEVDQVLLPLDIFGVAKAPAPAPVADSKPVKSVDQDSDDAPAKSKGPADDDDSGALGLKSSPFSGIVGLLVVGTAFLAAF
ncbi:fasciclin-like arabinogalactan protein 11 [Humulus lupulus]|uniref:fasciclin-like arabinogalactan protein 11 n=1 Tax=Humulus lupulus TaxID=3486 RepID=UPI002B40AA59|nr:fasciclin-like arabinogalactan protein 11 [Humulus lupulus]